MVTGLVVSLASSGCGGRGDGLDAAADAKAKALSARYLILLQAGGAEHYFSPKLTVIKRRGRVVAWTTASEEFSLRSGKGCYERHTDFNRDDARQERQAAWPSKVPYFKPEERDGVLVLSGREKHSDFADTEYELYLDAAGQLTMLRQRSAEFGVILAGRWATTRYRYPTATEFARLAGAVPQPRCT